MSGVTLKEGDRVVVTASNTDLRSMSCHHSVTKGSVHTIGYVGMTDYCLLVPSAPYIQQGWVELYEDYADEDWV